MRLRLFLPDLTKPTHAIVVFGCPAYPDGSPRPPLLRRLSKALELAVSDPEAMLVLSGGAVHGPAEAGAMARWLAAQGVASERFIIEEQSRFTLQNAERVAAVLAEHTLDRVTLVTERFHMRRSAHLLRHRLRARGLFVELASVPAPDAVTVGRPLVAVAELIKLGWDRLSMAAGRSLS